MKTKEELEEAIKDTITKDIIFGPGSPVCMVCLDELRNHLLIDEKVYDQSLIDDMIKKLAWDKLQKNIVIDGDVIINRRTGEVLDSEVDYTIWKNNHKITCCKVEVLHFFKWHSYPGYLKYLQFFIKNFPCLLFFLVQVILLGVLS